MEIAKLPKQVASSFYSGYSSNRLGYPPIGKLTPNATKWQNLFYWGSDKENRAGSILKSKINKTRVNRVKLYAAVLRIVS